MNKREPDMSTLIKIAQRVNWYTEPERLVENTDLFLCHIMTRGDATDISRASQYYAKDVFRQAYEHSPPGLFDARSWSYWGLMLFDDQNHRALPEREKVFEDTNWKGEPNRN